MKRWTLELTLCLLAGAVVTWAVAWGCALFAPLNQESVERFEGPRAQELCQPGIPVLEPEYATRTLRIERSKGFGLQIRSCSASHQPKRGLESPIRYHWDEITAGFPCASLQGLHSFDIAPERVTTIYAPHWLQNPQARIRLLPMKLLPLGFALDTVLYGGVVLGVVEGVGLARRRRRIAKGRCHSCGYDRRGLAGGAATACPECGRF